MKWKDITKDWEDIPTSAYKLMFSQSKDRYEEIISESEAITNKAMKLITITGIGLTSFVTYKFKVNPGLEWIILFTFLYLLNFILLLILLFPKNVIYRGSPPNEIFLDYLDNKELKGEEKTALIYYHELIRYQNRIDQVARINTKRQLFYSFAITLTFVNSILTASVIISTIF